MLYNINKDRIKRDSDCGDCEYFDTDTKTCNGFGVKCFEFDPITQTCLDPITKLPFDPKEKA